LLFNSRCGISRQEQSFAGATIKFHVDARGNHVAKLALVPRHRAVTEILQSRWMRGERVGAIDDVFFRRRVVPIEIVGSDDAVLSAK
jgi:hypothetical protein